MPRTALCQCVTAISPVPQRAHERGGTARRHQATREPRRPLAVTSGGLPAASCAAAKSGGPLALGSWLPRRPWHADAVSWLERWDKRNQARADDLMRNPNAGLDSPPHVWLGVLGALGSPGLIVGAVVGLVHLWRRLLAGRSPGRATGLPTAT